LVEKWNTDTSNIVVRVQPIPEGQSSEEIILAAVVAKTTPDIYANMWQGSIEAYAHAGVLIALDTLSGFLEFIQSRCSERVIREITSADGHIYQVPWKTNPIMMLYNPAFFQSLDEKGFPSTYSAFLEEAAKIQKDQDGDGYIDRWIGFTSVLPIWYQRLFNFYPLYLGASGGGKLIENNKAVFNNKHAIDAFRFLNTLYKQDYFPRERMSSNRDPFLAQNIATKITGPWEINYIMKFRTQGMEFHFTQLPVPDDFTGDKYTYGDPKNLVIFNTCKNPQKAWEFVKTMITKEGDLELLSTTGQFPRRTGLGRDPFFRSFFRNNPKMQVFADQVEYIVGIDNHELIVEVLDIISQEYESCVLYDMKTPEQAIADAAKAVDVLLASN
jgi:multiple sugar transport system substrate-binding protein